MEDTQLVKRLKSFAWRVGMVTLAGALAGIAQYLDILALSPFMTTIIGLALGEVSKYVNTQINRV